MYLLALNLMKHPQKKKKRADCLKENWAFGKSTSFTKNFVVGVVPLTASFSAWGLIGAEIYMGDG